MAQGEAHCGQTTRIQEHEVQFTPVIDGIDRWVGELTWARKPVSTKHSHLTPPAAEPST